MKHYDSVVFGGQTGACREAMAAGILGDCNLNRPVEIHARGLVVLFSEPMNQKAEAVMASNGIAPKNFTSTALKESDLTEHTLVLAMSTAHKNKILDQYENAALADVHVLTDYVGEELEILDPYGGPVSYYGLCYEALRKTIKKLVVKLNESEKAAETDAKADAAVEMDIAVGPEEGPSKDSAENEMKTV